MSRLGDVGHLLVAVRVALSESGPARSRSLRTWCTMTALTTYPRRVAEPSASVLPGRMAVATRQRRVQEHPDGERDRASSGPPVEWATSLMAPVGLASGPTVLHRTSRTSGSRRAVRGRRRGGTRCPWRASRPGRASRACRDARAGRRGRAESVRHVDRHGPAPAVLVRTTHTAAGSTWTRNSRSSPVSSTVQLVRQGTVEPHGSLPPAGDVDHRRVRRRRASRCGSARVASPSCPCAVTTPISRNPSSGCASGRRESPPMIVPTFPKSTQLALPSNQT